MIDEIVEKTVALIVFFVPFAMLMYGLKGHTDKERDK